MRGLYLILISSLFSQNIFGQKYLSEFIDSALDKSHFSDYDWAITYNKQQSGKISIVDSLGNVTPELDWYSTIVISKIDDKLYIQKFKDTCFYDEKCFHAGKRLLLPIDITLNFTSDSINQADKEFIYPYIYKDDSIGTYYYQEPSDHSPRYSLSFLTKKVTNRLMFTDISFKEKLWLDFPKNLNFDYNSKTFIYRVFLHFENLFNQHSELITIE